MGRLDTKKTLLITGGLGFIGSHFVELALERGHRVINYDKKTYAANVDLTFKGDYQYLCVDIADIDDLPHCDIIVNFAAESHVDNSIIGPDVFVRSNVLGVHNMLEIIKNRKLKNMMHSWTWRPPLFVQISTDEVLGDIDEGFFKEDDRHKPSNPYSATKSCAEQLVVAWGRTYGLPYLITRTTNNYGPRQHIEKLIPSVVDRLLTGKSAIVHGSGDYIRNWIHVEDNVEALFLIIDEGIENEIYHIATDEEHSVKEVVTKVCSRLKLKYEDVIDTSTDRSGADVRYALNYDKIKQMGWKPTRTFDDYLNLFIQQRRNCLLEQSSQFIKGSVDVA